MNKVLLILKERGEEIHIGVYDTFIPLLDFESRSKDDDKLRLFRYFCAIINLCADLCLDRNITAIHPLQEIYPFNICYNIIKAKTYNMKLRHAFTRLITTLWIDKDFIKCQLPNRIRVWDNLDSHKGMMAGINATE